MRKLLGTLAFLALLGMAQPAIAQSNYCCAPKNDCCTLPVPCCGPCDPCCDPCCADWCLTDGCWEVGAHALLFLPVSCEFDYAVVPAPTITTGDRVISDSFTNKCELDWGFRVFGQYNTDCALVGISYQWFFTNPCDSASGDPINMAGVSGNAINGTVTSKQRLRYQNFDARIGWFLRNSCKCQVYTFVNGRWIDLNLRREITQRTEGDMVYSANEKSALEGGALGVGVGAQRDVWCGVGLFGEANVLGVIASRSTRETRFDDGGQLTTTGVHYASETCINPELNFKVGLNYTQTCGCWTFVGELGYEFDYFWDAFAFANSIESGLANTTSAWRRHCENIGFSGLFFGGRVLF